MTRRVHRRVHLVVPDSIDDAARPSGGNHYDRRIRAGLAAAGWDVRQLPVAGAWPDPDPAALDALRRALATVPDAEAVLVDGLIGSAAPGAVLPEAERLALVALVHMPFDDERERAVLAAARAIVTTSSWTRQRLLTRYALPPGRVRVAEPGVDPAPPAPGTAGGGELLCVAAITPLKGHDRLLTALAGLSDRTWRCTLVGSLGRDPRFVEHLRHRARADGLGTRVGFAGARTGPDLDAHYGAADVLVLASAAESYGMVVTEALAHGLPVIAAAVGGVPEALGHAADGQRPGLLVHPDDPAALRAALGRWLDDADLRHRLRAAARSRHESLPTWAATSARIGAVLAEVAVRLPVRSP